MMEIEEFLKTVYVGDRYVKEIVLDSYKKEVKIKINSISRIREHKNHEWGFCNDEDIEDGYIVFTGVSYFSMEPSGLIPNDELYYWQVKKVENDLSEIDLYMGSYNNFEKGQEEIIMKLTATGVCLEDPQDTSNRSYN